MDLGLRLGESGLELYLSKMGEGVREKVGADLGMGCRGARRSVCEAAAVIAHSARILFTFFS